MKKALLVVGVVLVLFAVGGAVWVVNAQTDTPQTPDQDYNCPMGNYEDGQGWGGHMGRGGMMERNFDENSEFGCGVEGEYGPMHETIVNALAEATGLSVDEINTKMSNGETMYQIASDAGLSEEQINDLFTQAHQDAFEALGEDNGFFQEHLDRMKQMWNGEFTPDFGRGGRSGQGGCQDGNFEGMHKGMHGNMMDGWGQQF